jgi:hypothetical protein
MDDVTAPKKINIPLLALILVVIVAAIIIFSMRSSPEPATTPLEGPAPNPPAVTDPDLSTPQSPAPGGMPDTNLTPPSAR